jgi:hypothetical protein
MDATNMNAHSIAFDLAAALNCADGDPRCQSTVLRVVRELGLTDYYSVDASNAIQRAYPNPIHAVCAGGEYALVQYQVNAGRWI